MAGTGVALTFGKSFTELSLSIAAVTSIMSFSISKLQYAFNYKKQKDTLEIKREKYDEIVKDISDMLSANNKTAKEYDEFTLSIFKRIASALG